MSKKQWLIFIGLILLPIAIGFTFRTIDNYRFHQQILNGSPDHTSPGTTVYECEEFFLTFGSRYNAGP